MLRSGLGMPYECNAGGCGSCKFTLVDGELSEDLEAPAGLRASDRRKNKRLACISRARSDCVIAVRLDNSYEPKIRPSKTRARCLGRRPLTHDLWEFDFETDGAAEFLPGQYAKLHIPGVLGPRSYSMSNTANDDGHWSFQVKRVPGGAATSALFERELGQLGVTIDAPYSIAHLDRHSFRAIVCIAGGSGLAPMVSILHGVAESPGRAGRPVLYYGARTSEDVVDPAYFAGINGFDPERQYVPVVSEDGPDSEWRGATGFVHEHLAAALSDDCSDCDFYVAGPPPMVEAVRRHLILDRHVPVEQLHYDRFF